MKLIVDELVNNQSNEAPKTLLDGDVSTRYPIMVFDSTSNKLRSNDIVTLFQKHVVSFIP